MTADSTGEGDLEEIDLSAILLLPEMQPRSRTDRQTVERYRKGIKSGVKFPPLKVASVGGSLVLLDGFHRYAAMQLNRQQSALVRHLGTLTWEEARWVACQANLSHGLPLKTKELRVVFRAYVEAGQHLAQRGRRGAIKSYRVIASELGGTVAHTTVRKWMEEDFPRAFAAASREASGKGGGLRSRNTGATMFSETSAALDHALAAAPAVTDPNARYRLLIKARALVAALEDGTPEVPDF